jgi:hypothetical protein
MPTMALWEIFRNGETGEAPRQRLAEVRYMPRSTVDEWVKRKNALLQTGGNVFMGFGAGAKSGARVIELRRKTLKGLREAGARIALGTDSPSCNAEPGTSPSTSELSLKRNIGQRPTK